MAIKYERICDDCGHKHKLASRPDDKDWYSKEAGLCSSCGRHAARLNITYTGEDLKRWEKEQAKAEHKLKRVKSKPTRFGSPRKTKSVDRTGRLISHSGRTTRQHRGSVIR